MSGSVGQWVNGSLNQINLDLIEIIQLWTFWTFLDILLKPPQPLMGLFFPCPTSLCLHFLCSIPVGCFIVPLKLSLSHSSCPPFWIEGNGTVLVVFLSLQIQICFIEYKMWNLNILHLTPFVLNFTWSSSRIRMLGGSWLHSYYCSLIPIGNQEGLVQMLIISRCCNVWGVQSFRTLLFNPGINAKCKQ